ncbi:phenylalanine--tRNA ligase subunit alpha [Candidatus Roizmanbacteria bacterium CG_4_10_14_0_8_um_filter_39_9]|uniref:Phenylalanine--tRNA ligase alpha subunit n=1 Tax=Candidatus Roizmanbacteria bacterium CG_4_10_14_0_8_um_filter_39_9 TaxID=1974829 RepID=A0A2M7QC92_9BACT|nr:MAG: phenylalanine--tRNA ligase subunit alpha [Candidatus Roizmanbacteria bacterium CG_4_10_14_0_8_um_filter_39_9]
MDQLTQLRSQFNAELLEIKSPSEIQLLDTKYLGRNGLINTVLQHIKEVPADQKKEYGTNLNELKQEIIRSISEKKTFLLQSAETKQQIDVTLPGTSYPKGSLHLITIAIDEITSIFEKIGFIRVSYPEVEYEFFSFESLNMPKTHAARDDFETSFIEAPVHPKWGKMLLTPHTSSGQVREMWRVKTPPVRMINISKTYRPNWDATHTPMFFQFEGLCLDNGINITHLKGTLDYFVKSYFGEDIRARLRPHHFQFTEPSFEVDVTCTVCKGTSINNGQKCKICKSGWLELGGTGMVHPNVLKSGNIDPKIYTGWAFGFGIERVIMMKFGIDDIRNYYSGDIRFLEQF